MSQQLTIQYGLKTFKVKATPSMSLKDVLDKAVQHFKLETSATDYGLQRGKTNLDLVIPIRLANLPQGCNIALVERKKLSTPAGSQSDQVNIRLQVNSETKTQQFVLRVETAITVSEMLQRFETEYGINLLNKVETITKKHIGLHQNMTVEYKPVLQIFTTIISPGDDFSKELFKFGITSGNVGIRLTYQKSKETVISEEKVAFEPNDPVQEEEILVDERDVLNDLVDQEILAEKEAKYETTHTEATIDDSLAAIDGDGDHDLRGISPPKLFNPQKDHLTYKEEDDRSYEISIDQAKLYHKLVTNSGLNDRTRQKLNAQKKHPVVKFVSVRVKLPDLSILELNFDKDETVNHIFEVLRTSYLVDSELKFKLFQSYPHRLVEPGDKKILEVLGPKTVLLLDTEENVSVLRSDIELGNLTYAVDDDKSNTDDEVFIPKETSIAEETPLTRGGSSAGEKKLPKWFKIGKK